MLLKLDDEELYYKIEQKFYNAGGVYILKVFSDTKYPIQISRFFDIDNEGIIYIGKATCFLDRVLALKKSIFMKSNNHIAGRKIKRLKDWNSKLEGKSIYVELIEDNSPETFEREKLNEYLQRFGELPPLNSF